MTTVYTEVLHFVLMMMQEIRENYNPDVRWDRLHFEILNIIANEELTTDE